MTIEERESADNIRRISPIISQVYQLGKEKKHDEAFQALLPSLQQGEVPTYFCQPAGWAIYRYLHDHLHDIKPDRATTIFGYYLSFCRHQPDLVHSFIMMLAVGCEKLFVNQFQFADFCRAWGLDNFRNEDFQSQTSDKSGPNGKPIVYSSLAARAATLLYKEIKTTRSPELCREFLPFFRTVLRRDPDYEFTALYIANLSAWAGQADQAIAQFKAMLISNQQWYLWRFLGDLLEPGLRASCYCKALTLCDKEDYIGDIHLFLAGHLLSADPPHAAHELHSYMTTYQSHGWTIKTQAYQMEKALRGVAPATDAAAFYQARSEAAEQFVYDGQPQAEFTYLGISPNRAGKPRARLQCQKPRLSVAVSVGPIIRHAHPGDIFLAHYHQADHRVTLLTLHPTGRHADISQLPSGAAGAGRHPSGDPRSEHHPSGETRDVEGTVKIRPGQEFAFLGNYFISPPLRQREHLENGQHIRARVVQQPDGRWRVVKILEK